MIENLNSFLEKISTEHYYNINKPWGEKTIEDARSKMEGKDIIIVGNSKNILRRKYGELIDSHDCVIRFNLGFNTPERYIHLGEKTDIWIINWGYGIKRTRKKYNSGYRFFKDRADLYLFLASWRNHTVSKDFAKKCYMDNLDNFIDITREVGEKPSSGLLAINFIMKNINFKSLSIVGFDFNRSKTSLSGWPKGYKCPYNALGKEELYIRKFIEDGVIRFYPV